MPNKNIPNKTPVNTDAFITWEDGDFKGAQAAIGQAYSAIRPVMRSSAADFSVREGMDRNDYEVFRPGESLPKKRADILAACAGAYARVSPIKSIIDMMVDFTTEGIRLVHPNPQVQQFYQNWWEKVDGDGRSQHFANSFYLLGTAIVKRNMAKLSARVADDLQRGLAAVRESEIYDLQPSPASRQTRNVIPWSYDFLNPSSVIVVGGDLAMFTGQQQYAIELPQRLINVIKNPQNEYDKQLVAALPSYIRDPIKNGHKVIFLDESRVAVYHYKKNDWEEWANPILYSVMDDIVLLQKMKLTDLAALDGAISHIRIWKLGSLEHKIVPTAASLEKLNEVLIHAGNGQSFDLIWGPDLTLEEKTSDVYKYLGQEKYAPVYSSLYSGLGVPPTLVGGAGGDKGFTNNFLSLKTLIERLNYGRRALRRFWNNEIRIIQQAMQFRFPAQVEFKNAVLTDEAAFNSLLIDLLDRDVISVERVREHLGYIPEIEDSLVRYEWKGRNNSKMPPKSGPFHHSEKEHDYKKILATSGVVTPSQLGLDLPEPKPGEKTPLEHKALNAPTSPAQRGQQGEGRPRNSRDTTPRKTKRVVPRTAAEDHSVFMDLFIWAKEAQNSIGEIVNPLYLKMCNKKNMRSLTASETEDIEHLKFAILCNLTPYSEINQQSMYKMIKSPLPSHPQAEHFWKVLVATYMERKGATPTVDDIRQIQSYVYALYKGDDDGSNHG